MNLQFEHFYQQKYLKQTFAERFVISASADVLAWREKWLAELKTWHSPYKALVDCSNITVSSGDEKIKKALERTMKFLEGFFLKNAVGFGYDAAKGHDQLPFKVLATESEALESLGIRGKAAPAAPADFRAAIQFQNHFNQHSIELTFTDLVTLDTKEKFATLRSKLMNTLMQWHSRWNLIIDCSSLEIPTAMHAEFLAMDKFFKGLHLKQIIGYSPKPGDGTYPFPVFRARHKAAAALEAEGSFSGEDAHCRSGTKR